MNSRVTPHHPYVSIAEWGQPKTMYSMHDHPILKKYVTGKLPTADVHLYHLLRKLNVIKAQPS